MLASPVPALENDMRDILVYASRSDRWDRGVAYAARLAALHGGTLTAVHVCPLPQFMMPAFGSAALLTELVEHNRRLEEQARAAETEFVDWAKKRGVAQPAWQVVEGFAPAVLAQLGNWHDLLVVQRDESAPWQTATELGSVLLHAGLPTLVVPPADGFDPQTTDCIALAWNGAPEALRAIHIARPLLARARRIVLFKGADIDPCPELGWMPPFDIMNYFRRHGIVVEERDTEAPVGSVGAALLERCADVKADLLVMGAYGRTRLSEWALGGATRHVLGHAHLPVLMRH